MEAREGVTPDSTVAPARAEASEVLDREPCYQWQGDDDAEAVFSLSLHSARVEKASHRLGWSVSALYDSFANGEGRSVHFPVVGEVSPFANRRFHVTNSLPFDPEFLRRVIVEVRYTGPAGGFEHASFRFPEEGEFHEIATQFPSINTDFQLESRVQVLLMPSSGSGWPAFWPAAAEFERESEALVEVTPERARVRVCAVRVDASAFDKASRIECGIRSVHPGGASGTVRTVHLHSGRTSAAMVLANAEESEPLEIECRAYPPDGLSAEPVLLVSATALPRDLTIPTHRLEVLEPDTVRVRLMERGPRLVFAAIAFKAADAAEEEEGRLRVFRLEEDEPEVVWAAWRSTVFEPRRYVYRTQVVVLDAAGKSQPMQVGEWTAGTESEWTIVLPEIQEANPEEERLTTVERLP
jgi:hypothetical protein